MESERLKAAKKGGRSLSSEGRYLLILDKAASTIGDGKPSARSGLIKSKIKLKRSIGGGMILEGHLPV
ncbi:hypothetical protein D3C78_1071570 [compost metagenome]